MCVYGSVNMSGCECIHECMGDGSVDMKYVCIWEWCKYACVGDGSVNMKYVCI